MVAIIMLILLVILIIIIIYSISVKKFNYWKKKNVPYIKPKPFYGNYKEYIMMRKYAGYIAQELCRKFPGEPYFGTFFGTEPALMIKDPDIIKLVYTQDFYYFCGREISKYTFHEVMTQNLFFTYGDRWKVLRQNLTPFFSTAKMKNMFYLIEERTHAFEKLLEHETKISEVIEAKELVARFTIDCICSCAFGIKSGAMGEDIKTNPFRRMAAEIFKSTKYRGFKLAARSIWPVVFYGLGQKCFPTEMYNFLLNILKKNFEDRNHKPTDRQDFVDLILNFKKDNYIVGDSLSNSKTGNEKTVRLNVDDDMLASMAVMFFAAGLETSAITLNFTLYEFAKNQEVQNKAFNEIRAYLERNKLDYNCIKDLPYLTACILEIARLYPAMGISTREVMEDYEFRGGLTLKKGVRVHIPIYYLHRNPDHFPNPDMYIPERHLPGAAYEIKPYTFFPFGEGHRICIGDKYAKMQVMSGLITILKNYRVELADDTPPDVELDPRVILTQAAGDLNLKFIRRSVAK